MIRVLTALAITLVAIGLTGLIIVSFGRLLLAFGEGPATIVATVFLFVILFGAAAASRFIGRADSQAG
jgi:hypothetical protein